MWSPNLQAFDGALYERIAAALERDIQAGILLPGTKLPTLKKLAAGVGVTPGTVNRAYELAQRRGLVEGEVGRGTFVSSNAGRSDASRPAIAVTPSDRNSPSDEASEPIDLSLVKPNTQLQERYVRAALSDLAQSDSLSELLDYTPDGGLAQHRQAGAAWMRANGFPARAEQVLLTAGAQHGIWVAVNALTKPDDLVVCESLCYPGITSVVHSLGRRMLGVPMDSEGMDPNALRDLCQRQRPAIIICVATCQNPSTALMSVERRRAIAEIAREFDTALLDDDIYGFLSPCPVAPLATFAPERTAYLTSLSKSVAATVRLGYMHCPPEWLPRMTASVRMSIWMVSPLAAQVGTNLVATGRALEMAKAQRDEAEARQLIAADALGAFEFRAQPTSFHLWLKLPQHWPSGDQFAAMARGHQLLVAGGDAFSANRDGEGRHFLRIALLASTREQTRFALAKLAGLLGASDSAWL